MKRTDDKCIKYKTNIDYVNKKIDIQVFKNTFYLKIENVNNSNKKDILNAINNPFKNDFISKEEYAEILNYITYELCISRFNDNLYHDLYFSLMRKNMLDIKQFETLFNIK